MTYSLMREGMQQREVSAPRVDTFWVVLLEESGLSLLPLRVGLPSGREALALFSGEDEARMFCSLREEAAEGDAHLRETSVGEVISLLYCPPDGVQARGAGPSARDPGQQALGTYNA